MIVRSAKYLAGARGAPCALEIPGTCMGGTEATVAAHVRDGHTGRGIKASDLCVIDACYNCHRRFDGHDGQTLTREDWLFYALRALQRTLERRVELGLLTVAGFDPNAAPKPRRVPARKPKSQRGRLESRSNWPEGRKIPKRVKG